MRNAAAVICEPSSYSSSFLSAGRALFDSRFCLFRFFLFAFESDVGRRSIYPPVFAGRGGSCSSFLKVLAIGDSGASRTRVSRYRRAACGLLRFSSSAAR